MLEGCSERDRNVVVVGAHQNGSGLAVDGCIPYPPGRLKIRIFGR
jgi:hypothetical protein